MAHPLKGLLFFLFAVCLLRASPALSVPLASVIDRPGTVSYGSSDDAVTNQDATETSAQYGTLRRVGGGAEGESEARIVDSQELAYGPHPDNAVLAYNGFGTTGKAAPMISASGSKTPGWIKPAAAVGAGASLYALLSKGKGKDNPGNGGFTTLGGGHDQTNLGGNDETPSSIPEPGTIAMLGIGLASVLGRRKIVKK